MISFSNIEGSFFPSIFWTFSFVLFKNYFLNHQSTRNLKTIGRDKSNYISPTLPEWKSTLMDEETTMQWFEKLEGESKFNKISNATSHLQA